MVNLKLILLLCTVYAQENVNSNVSPQINTRSALDELADQLTEALLRVNDDVIENSDVIRSTVMKGEHPYVFSKHKSNDSRSISTSNSRQYLNLTSRELNSSFNLNREENRKNQSDNTETSYLPFTPYFTSVEGNSVYAATNTNITDVEKLAMRIALEIENEESLSKQHTMSKFILLTRLIETMNSKQIEQLANRMFVDRNQADCKEFEMGKKLLTWDIYINAVGTTGTKGALETIKMLIENGNLRGERAAQIISRLEKIAKIPDQEYMEVFFSIVKSPVVLEQQNLNSTAVLAFSGLLRKFQVKHHNVPFATFGPLGSDISKIILEKYIFFLEDNLKSAISNNDSHKAQIFIKALGRTGNPRILDAFKDFLNYKRRSSQYQRFLMVYCLYDIAMIHSQLVQPILLKIYQNFAEEDALRVAAINNIMLTNPTVEILQMLALSTHNEPSRSVKSTVITAIKSAADNNSRKNNELTRNAKAALHMLKSRNYGQTSSKTKFFSIAAGDVDVAYESVFSYTQSEEHTLPASASLFVRKNIGGIYEDEFNVAAMTSTVNNFLEKLFGQFSNRNRKHKNAGSNYSKVEEMNKWNAKMIAKSLGVKISSAPDVEATFMYELFGGNRAIALDSDSIDSLAQKIKEKYVEIKNSSFQFTTFYNEVDFNYGFPTAMGLPFFYCDTRPVMVHMQGETNIQTFPDILKESNNIIDIPQQINITSDIKTSFSWHVETKFGIAVPFNNHKYMSVLEKHIEMNIAFQSETTIDTEEKEIEMKIKPKNDKKQVLFLYETIPYTSKYDEFNMKPALEQNGSAVIHIRKPVQVHYKLGKYTTGLILDYNAVSESIDEDEHFFDLSFFNFNRMSPLPFPFILRGGHRNYVSLVYDPSQSSTDAVKITSSYKYNFDRNKAESSGDSFFSPQSLPDFREASVVSDRKSRQKEFLKRVAKVVPDANSFLLDFTAEFENLSLPTNKLTFTAAFASSDVSPVANALIYYGFSPRSNDRSYSGTSYEVCVSTSSHFPRIPEINSSDALKNYPNSSFLASVAFGQDCKSGYQFDFKANLFQSDNYRKIIENNSVIKLCNHFLEKEDALSTICQNAVDLVAHFDSIKLSTEVKQGFLDNDELPSGHFNKPRYAAKKSLIFPPISVWLNKFGLNYIYNKKQLSSSPLPENKYEVLLEVSEHLDYINLTLSQGAEEMKFTRAFFDKKQQLWQSSLVQWLTDSIIQSGKNTQNMPSCLLINNSVTTFDNAKYAANFDKDWKVVFLYTPKQINPIRYLIDMDVDVQYNSEDQNIAVIARESTDGKDVQMIIGDYVIELRPTGKSDGHSFRNPDAGVNRTKLALVLINGQETTISSSSSIYITPNTGEYIAKIYAEQNGDVTVKSQKYGLTLKYNTNYFIIYVAGYYKSNIRGLCGTYDDNKYNDFTIPSNCVVKDPRLFLASHTLKEGEEISHAKNNLRHAANVSCYKETFYYFNVISMAETPESELPSSQQHTFHSAKSRSFRKHFGILAFGHSKKNDSGSEYSNNITSHNGSLIDVHSTNCLISQVKYIDYPIDNNVCFSTQPIPECKKGCISLLTIGKLVPFLCIEKRENAIFWMNEIEKGRSLVFSKYSPNKYINVTIPEKCASN